ncbi:methyltransferase [Halomonas cerina]|uniref:Methyltransferase domain-containing protein n=1 Tax=Halomonas cerina TaxID=447424 RepID=A0A839V6F3_9GAMM|nr:methyltransferase [Halomonas cerina]MBB3191002.1 hypothetical protein [Halomonas cerina]
MSLSHAEHFRRLTVRLAEWQPLWQPLPFRHSEFSWTGSCPGLTEALLSLPDAEVARLQDTPFEASPLAAWLPVEALARLVELPDLGVASGDLPSAWGEGVGARKWQQIAAFAPQVATRQALVEWCAGKGHLARALSRLQETRVTALEWQPGLCRAGQALAEQQGLPVRLVNQDVLDDEARRWLTPATQVAALHACGDLHGRLLELAAQSGASLTLAPCCYQRTAAETYRPLSRLGRELSTAYRLSLTREDLTMAVQETVTAPRGVRRHREWANAWRLGFDRLQRRLRGRNTYLPVPSLAYGRLPATFADFCRWAAEQKGLVLPEGVDWATHERAGWQRLAEVSRLELVRHLFRRPLEVWLVLDRALRLEEAGFRVTLGSFCARALTPRNLLLKASRPA